MSATTARTLLATAPQEGLQPATAPLPRLVGTATGPGDDPHTSSGTARPLFDALARRYPLERLDVSMNRAERALAMARAFRPERDAWRRGTWNSVVGFGWMSRRSERFLEARRGSFDLAVQVYGLFQTRGGPYVMHLDTTHELARRHWPAWSPYGGRDLRRWFAQERRAYLEAEHLFPVSTAVKTSLVEFYGVPEERITVVLAGSNFHPLPPARPRVQEPTVLFVGREWERKGGPALLEAFAAVRERVPEARLVVVGTTECPEAPGVEVLGKIMDRERLAQIMSEAAVFTVPSIFCPFTNSLMEAMAYGLPCVATTTMGTPELVVHGETGLLCEPGDAAGLARALERLLVDRELADRMGAAGRDRVVRELSWDRVVDRMAPVIDRLVAERRPSA